MDLLEPKEGPQAMPEVFDLDHDQAVRSLDRIEDLPAELLLPGHGRPWWGSPSDAVAAARSAETA